jgi:ketosteroid isomerase-like protein
MVHGIRIIFPDGGTIEGYDDILSFHKEWFADMDWRMDFEILDIYSNGLMGYALMDVVYHDLDENGSPYEMNYYLSLLFEKIDNKWILIRDQNTLKQ